MVFLNTCIILRNAWWSTQHFDFSAQFKSILFKGLCRFQHFGNTSGSLFIQIHSPRFAKRFKWAQHEPCGLKLGDLTAVSPHEAMMMINGCMSPFVKKRRDDLVQEKSQINNILGISKKTKNFLYNLSYVKFNCVYLYNGLLICILLY